MPLSKKPVSCRYLLSAFGIVSLTNDSPREVIWEEVKSITSYFASYCAENSIDPNVVAECFGVPFEVDSYDEAASMSALALLRSFDSREAYYDA